MMSVNGTVWIVWAYYGYGTGLVKRLKYVKVAADIFGDEGFQDGEGEDSGTYG